MSLYSSRARPHQAHDCRGLRRTHLVYPVDCVKTALQCLRPLEGARYRGLLDGLATSLSPKASRPDSAAALARCIWRRSGARALLCLLRADESWPALGLVMNIPFHVVHFNAYELAQDYVNSERHYAPSTHVISGAIAALRCGLH
uniref:NAD_binding_4 domain-containing protein n=1 Tax=Macrostomum lignano TaxID=282301 RepID=A0A1I8FL24_9PLAT